MCSSACIHACRWLCAGEPENPSRPSWAGFTADGNVKVNRYASVGGGQEGLLPADHTMFVVDSDVEFLATYKASGSRSNVDNSSAAEVTEDSVAAADIGSQYSTQIWCPCAPRGHSPA